MIVLVKGFNMLCDGVVLHERTDCGYPYISEYDCNKRGCCFDSRRPGYWCFYPSNMIRGSLNNDCFKRKPNARSSCGYPEISETECNKRGCCFDSSVPNVPLCFYNSFATWDLLKTNTNEKYICHDMVPPTKRVKCGYDGISLRECQYQKCCFDDSITNAYSCFYPSTMVLGGLSYSCTTISPDERVACGFPEMSEGDCYRRNCCWDNSNDPLTSFGSPLENVPWCFFPNYTH